MPFCLPCTAYNEWLIEGHPKKKGEGEAPVKTCPECFACVPANTKICPHCDYEFEVRVSQTELKEDFSLVKINEEQENRIRFYLSPKECRNVEELRIYARQHGYKPGWVWYQQKARGSSAVAKNETQLQNAIRVELSKIGIVRRNNVGTFYTKYGVPIVIGIPGETDLTLFMKTGEKTGIY